MKSILMLALAVFALMVRTACASDPPARVVSMNVCADQDVVALADKNQVAALSNYARNPALSYYATQAQGYPISSDSVEEVLMLKPDLIISGAARRGTAMAELRRRGFRVVEVNPAESYEAIVEQIRLVAGVLEHPERGAALIANMDRELAALPPPQEPRPEAAYYQRRGFLTGTGTLVDEIMRRAGFRNLASHLALASVTRMPLEVIIQAKPDYLIMESEADPTVDNGSALLFHPALEKAVPVSRRLFLPQAMTVCGGPFFPAAVASLAAQLRH